MGSIILICLKSDLFLFDNSGVHVRTVYFLHAPVFMPNVFSCLLVGSDEVLTIIVEAKLNKSSYFFTRSWM